MPGAGKQTPEIQQQITELLEAGFDPTTIHRKLKVGRSSIYRMKRCLQQHGTPYMPSSLNKKNGRPKVLSTEQELEVRDWLRKPENRTRYLDDLVWLIHDRFGIVCSTTTMSKLKRKWLRVIDFEENGTPLDIASWNALQETHPTLPILQQPEARPLPEVEAVEDDQEGSFAHEPQLQHDPQLQQSHDLSVQTSQEYDMTVQHPHVPNLPQQQMAEYPESSAQYQHDPHHDLTDTMLQQHQPPPAALMMHPMPTSRSIHRSQMPEAAVSYASMEQQLGQHLLEPGQGWAMAGAERGAV